MNYLNVSIFIIATFLIVTGEFFFLPKHSKRHEWESKSTKDRKILRYAKDAVKLYNEINHSMLTLNQVLAARRIYEGDSKHYNLKILANNDCNRKMYGCTEEIIADIIKNNEHPHKLKISVRNYWRENNVNLIS
uniref:SCP domain-containing protein n=1 Tax=Strongyloides papillosus TaxID=174720 RepID=A0A0N5B731_STREA